jgi:hypothetical protein
MYSDFPVRYRSLVDVMARIKVKRALSIRTAFTKLLASEPRRAIEHANAAFDEANRAERERLPVTL